MKKLGYALITFGFLAGSFIAVLDEINVQWIYFIAALLFGAVGIIIVNTSQRIGRKSADILTANLQDITDSVTRIVENMKKLNEEKNLIDTYDMRHQIDKLFANDLTIFTEARESLAHAHGLQVYADVMSNFAAGERYLNRVWSASADGYINEVNTYLDKAQEQFTQAHQKISRLNESNT